MNQISTLNRISLVLVMLQLTFAIVAQDNTPPEITTPAQSLSVSCNSSNIIGNLTDWHQSNGGAMATDNSGSFTFIGEPTLSQALIIFEQSRDSLCGNTQSVTVGFTAVDASGNQSVTTFAKFSTFDNSIPVITQSAQDVEVECTADVRDSLIAWIRSHGHAEATDLCSDSLQWTNFVSNLPPFGTFPIDEGPYPNLPPSKCNAEINVTFFVDDGCGNQTATTGSFTIMDSEGPVLDTLPPDITVACDEIPAPPVIIAFDQCSGELFVNMSQIDNQNPDSTLCEHYNYEILRNWTTQDICGNSTTHLQSISVRDLESPVIEFENPLIVSCEDILSNNVGANIDTLYDDCSEDISLTFTDNGTIGTCNFSLTRIYTATDICDNSTQEVQTLLVRDTTPPVILVPAKDSIFPCGTDADLDAAFAEWVITRAGSISTDECSTIGIFAAVPGSYDPNDSGTWPGTPPGTFDLSQCPSDIDGFVRSEVVDFLHIDLCNNLSVTSAIFGIRDSSRPIVGSCPSDRVIDLAQDNCELSVFSIFPDATDNCTPSSSPLRQSVSQPVSSIDPGNPEVLVNQVKIAIGPFNPTIFEALSAPSYEFTLERLDIDDSTEFFEIFNEDGVKIGETPNTRAQCGDTTITIQNQSLADFNKWLQDGFIDFTFVPSVPTGNASAGVNAVCPNSRIVGEAIVEIRVDNVLTTYYQVNNDAIIDASIGDSIQADVSVGINTVTYIFEDCANNRSSCAQTIEVRDLFAPIIECSDTLFFELPLDTCDITYKIPLGLTLDENCRFEEAYNVLQPALEADQLLTFEFDSFSQNFIAVNRTFNFNNVVPIDFGEVATLEVTVTGDINDLGEIIEIVGEGGIGLGFTQLVERPNCQSTTARFEIPKVAFNQWADDDVITIDAIMPVGIAEGGGINPCTPLQPGETTDGVSLMTARLVYYDPTISYTYDGIESTVPSGSDTLEIALGTGIFEIDYAVSDLGGNESSCTQVIEVIDNQIPFARCKDATINIHPSGVLPNFLSPDSLNDFSSDNCITVSTMVVADTFECGDIGLNFIGTLIVEDLGGNQDTCTSTINVVSFPLQPTFVAGLCEGDDVQLFANLPEPAFPNGYTFEWTKNGVLVSNNENPTIPNTATDLNGIYNLRVTSSNGCISNGSVEVMVTPFIEPDLTVISDGICKGDDLILNSTEFTGEVVYSWYQVNGNTNELLGTSAGPAFAITPDDSISVYFVIANNTECETPPSDSITITTYDQPLAQTSSDTLFVCLGDNVFLQSNNTDTLLTYSWSGPNGYTSNKKDPIGFTGNNTTEGLYKLVVNLNGCQSDTASSYVSIASRPPTPDINGELIYCKGSNFSLAVNNVTNGDLYEWYKNGLLFTTTNDNSLDIPNATTDLTGDWAVVVIINGCSSSVSTKLGVTVDELINVGASNSGPICAGDSVTLMATFVPNSSYEWSGPNFTGNGQTVRVPSVAGDYSVTITTNTNCSNVAFTEVVVNTPPAITALSSDNPGCVNQNTVITFNPTVFPNGNYDYAWSGPNGYMSDKQSPTLENLTNADKGVYTLTVFSANCPSMESSFDLDFEFTPETPSINGNLNYCEGDTIMISSNGSAETYQWKTPTGIFNLGSPVFELIGAGQSNVGTYQLVLKNGECESQPSNSLEINIVPTPSAPIIAGEDDVCFGSTINLTSNITSADEYSWILPDNSQQNSQSIIINNAGPINEGSYQLQYISSGCPSMISSPFTVNVRDSLVTPAFLDQTFSVCSELEDPIEICLDPNSLENGATYSLINEANNLIIATTSGLCFTVSDPSNFVNGSNQLVISGAVDGCTSRNSDAVLVVLQAPPPIIAQAVEDLIVTCLSDEFINIGANNGPPEVDVFWAALTPGINIGSPNSRNTVANNFLIGENLIELSYSKGGCLDFSRDTISVFLELPAEVEDDVLNVEINEPGSIDFLANDLLPDNYTIEFEDAQLPGSISFNDNVLTFQPDLGAAGTHELPYEVCVEGCEDLCERAIITIQIGFSSDCVLPTIFTPNNDGINDRLIIPCLGTNLYSRNKIYVFNEWGDQVFSAEGYDNSWEGTYGGEDLPVGTYYIVFEPENGKGPIRGFITLQR